MKKYLVIYLSSEAAGHKMSGSKPEDMKKEMEKWMIWAKKCGTGLIDMGTPLGNGLDVTARGSQTSKHKVVGYSMLQAENKDQALAMLKNHPHLQWAAGCEIEVHESLPLPGSG